MTTKTTSIHLRPLTLLAVLALLAAAAWAPAPRADAQPVTLPRVSPHAVLSQTVGLTEVTIDYHRPSVNEREIWGGLVPYGQVWRAGANENTTITFSDPVRVEGRELAAGSYGLHVIPGEDEWVIAFSTVDTAWGSFTYDEAEDALRVTVAPEPAPFEEQLRYEVSDVDLDSATVALHWAGLRVPFGIEVDTPKVVTESLEAELRGIARFNWQSWAQAANWLSANDVDQEKALEWIDFSINQNPTVNNHFVKAQILNRLERTDEAAAVLAEAEGLASSEAEMNALGYGFLQAGQVDKAIEIFQRNVDDHPGSWNVYDSLGEAHAAAGDTDRAVELYSKALEMAPEAQHPRIEGVLEQLQGSD